jgi:hypothetical protein
MMTVMQRQPGLCIYVKRLEQGRFASWADKVIQ